MTQTGLPVVLEVTGRHGRPVRPGWVAGPLLAPIAILLWSDFHSVQWILNGFVVDNHPGQFAGYGNWIVWSAVADFWVWAVALIATTLAYWRTTRNGTTGPQRRP